jgi:hypothetical protein
VDVLHHPLGVQRLVIEKRVARTEFVTVVPVGAPLRDAEVVHAFRFPAAQLLPAPGGGRRLTLFVRDWGKGPQEFGHFDVSALPVVPGATYEGELRLRGPRRIELLVAHEGVRHGPFVLAPAVHDPEAVLQTEDLLAAAAPS